MRRSRYLFFFVFFPSLLLPAFSYLAWRLTGFTPWIVLLMLPFLSVGLFPFLVLIRGRKKQPWEWLATQLAYTNMGFVSFLLVASVLRDLGGVFFSRWLSPLDVVVIAAIALCVAGFRGFFGPSVKRVRLKISGLPPGLEGLKIAQISDLHISGSIGESYVRRVVKKTAGHSPHLIALTGDIGDGRVADHAEEILALGELAEISPVFYVPGNHEAYWNHEEWTSAFTQNGFRVLLNRGEVLSHNSTPVFVAGITDPMFATLGDEHKPDLEKALLGSEGHQLRLLLSHRPHFADEASERGVQLQLSGHTHGGQFFPWTLVARLVHRYSLGAYQIGGMWVYVSAGTGSWGPRLRLGTRAEITLLELHS